MEYVRGTARPCDDGYYRDPWVLPDIRYWPFFPPPDRDVSEKTDYRDACHKKSVTWQDDTVSKLKGNNSSYHNTYNNGLDAQIDMRSGSPRPPRQRPLTCPPNQEPSMTRMNPCTSSPKTRKSFSPSLLRKTLSPRSIRRKKLDQRQWTLDDRCNGCGFPMDDERVSVKGDLYHLTCFKCSRVFKCLPEIL